MAAGHYESLYLVARHPSEPLAVWIRYTVLQHEGQAPLGSLWFTLFERDGPVARKVSVPGPVADPCFRIGEASFEPGRVVGEALDAGWELGFDEGEAELRHLPSYRGPLPRTKLLSPYPASTFLGWVSVAGRRIELDSWPGMVGHNWGSEHARRSIWVRADADGMWLDVAIARVAIGPVTTPWVAVGAISIDGERHSVRGPARVRELPGRCEFGLRGVSGEIEAPLERFVGWRYGEPGGGEHATVNCSIAEARLSARGRSVRAAGVYESQGGNPTVALEPYPDD